ncbi:hypothetical protein LguiA_001795 [Lonicera macranthoides]
MIRMVQASHCFENILVADISGAMCRNLFVSARVDSGHRNILVFLGLQALDYCVHLLLWQECLKNSRIYGFGTEKIESFDAGKFESLAVMEGPKWEDLIMDCLVNVFGRVGIESLVLDVPFVCKSWYEATLDPRCWQSLVFPYNLFRSRITDGYKDKDFFDVAKFIRFVVNRSQISVTIQALLNNCDLGAQCPSLPNNLIAFDRDCIILTNTEVEEFEVADPQTRNDYNMTLAILKMLPKLKYLVLSESILLRKNLLMILESGQAFVHLDVSYCLGFESNDEEILKLASHIKTFKCKGSKRFHDDHEFPWIKSNISL